MNDSRFVVRVVRAARAAGLDVRVFGGWAEELLGLAEPRPHLDVDLLCRVDDPAAVDRFVAEHDEVMPKRFPYKRACLIDSVLVEIFLVRDLVTRFGTLEYRWPADTFDDSFVASEASVRAYRRDHESIRAARAA